MYVSNSDQFTLIETQSVELVQVCGTELTENLSSWLQPNWLTMMNACGNYGDEPCVYLSQQVGDVMDSSDKELQKDTQKYTDKEE